MKTGVSIQKQLLPAHRGEELKIANAHYQKMEKETRVLEEVNNGCKSRFGKMYWLWDVQRRVSSGSNPTS
jgi:hypothetical protein